MVGTCAGNVAYRAIDVATILLVIGIAIEQRRDHFQWQRRRQEHLVGIQRIKNSLAQPDTKRMIFAQLVVLLDLLREITRGLAAILPVGAIQKLANLGGFRRRQHVGDAD